jgi:hypothetical protein
VLTRLDPWSVMKLSFLLSIALGIITIVAVMVLWNVLDAMGVFTTVSTTYSELTTSAQGRGTDLMQYLGFSRVMGVATIIAAGQRRCSSRAADARRVPLQRHGSPGRRPARDAVRRGLTEG